MLCVQVLIRPAMPLGCVVPLVPQKNSCLKLPFSPLVHGIGSPPPRQGSGCVQGLFPVLEIFIWVPECITWLFFSCFCKSCYQWLHLSLFCSLSHSQTMTFTLHSCDLACFAELIPRTSCWFKNWPEMVMSYLHDQRISSHSEFTTSGLLQTIWFKFLRNTHFCM
jgi:hypothetical protein